MTTPAVTPTKNPHHELKFSDVLDFWFKELSPKDWFAVSNETDTRIRQRYLEVHRQAARGELFGWRKSAEGRLAEIIVLDQFSRNMFRGTPDAFAFDSIALVLAQEAVRFGADNQLSSTQKGFIYLPYMHSESLLIHAQGEILFKQPGLENSYNFEIRHRDILNKFGRYPHRNKILGRISTAEEIAFLKQPGSGF